MLGDDQACLNYPMRYPTVEFELVDTIELCEIVDTIRKGKGYRPVLEEGGDTSAWYSMYLGLNGYTWYKRTGMVFRQLKSLLRSLTHKGIIIELGEKGHKRFWIAYSDK